MGRAGSTHEAVEGFVFDIGGKARRNETTRNRQM
jgi:hypothetical protein